MGVVFDPSDTRPLTEQIARLGFDAWADGYCASVYREMAAWATQYNTEAAWRMYAHHTTSPDSAPTPPDTETPLTQWGRIITIPRAVLDNDDQGFLRGIPYKVIGMMERTVAAQIRAVFEGHALADDGLPAFAVERGNVIEGSGAALTHEAILDGLDHLRGTAVYLIVPPALAQEAAQLLNATVLIASGTGNSVDERYARDARRSLMLRPIVQVVCEKSLRRPNEWFLLPTPDKSPVHVTTRRPEGLAFSFRRVQSKDAAEIETDAPLMMQVGMEFSATPVATRNAVKMVAHQS